MKKTTDTIDDVANERYRKMAEDPDSVNKEDTWLTPIRLGVMFVVFFAVTVLCNDVFRLI